MVDLLAAQVNTLARLYQAAQRIGIGFYLAGIPGDNPGTVSTTSFEPKRMSALFRYAKGLAARGYPWLTAPPGLGRRELIPTFKTGRQPLRNL